MRHGQTSLDQSFIAGATGTLYLKIKAVTKMLLIFLRQLLSSLNLAFN